uniref:Conotoxin Lt28.2 n=1 Tax=Conus litteratus TaxID=89445 RepID=CDS2_CONLT|nr:RecName: Full=Conotoxin Lt28.2; AltName: Full=Conotoxin Lt15.3; Flags: Precursor [Conus litteratus]ADZ76485.1 conotoxin Lt15.3 [Conus litteratus]
MPKLEMMLLVLLILPLCYIDAVGPPPPWNMEDEIIEHWQKLHCHEISDPTPWILCSPEPLCGGKGCCAQEVCDCSGPVCTCPPCL